MNNDRPDLDELRTEYASVNRKDKAEFRKWFDTHQYLSVNDMAQVMRISIQVVRITKKKLGIYGPKTTESPIHRNPPIMPVELPADGNWRNYEWLSEAIKVHSLLQISKAVKLQRPTVREILRRLKITWITTSKERSKPKNKCCTHAWCYHHYIELTKTQAQCAKLAGIARQTFIGWLNRYDIPVRDCRKDHVFTDKKRRVTYPWERELISKLRKNPLVSKIQLRYTYIHVRYRDYFWENYYIILTKYFVKKYTFFKLTQANSKIKSVPIVYNEFQEDINEPSKFPAHIAISKVDIDNSTMLEKRLALHEFTKQLVRRGWIDPIFPRFIIDDDLIELKKTNIKKYITSNGYTSLKAKTKTDKNFGLRIMMSFFDFSDFHEMFKSPKCVVRLCNFLIEKKANFTFYNLIKYTSVNSHKIKRFIKKNYHIPDPLLYKAIFESLGITGTVLDINVGKGARAVACAIAGLTYTTIDQRFEKSVELGIIEFLSMNYVKYDNRIVDLVLYDNDHDVPDMNAVLPYLNSGNKLMVFVPGCHIKDFLKYEPKSMIKIQRTPDSNQLDSLFIW